jgi:hypothetical protein
LMKFKLNRPVIINGQRFEAGEEVEMTKGQANGFGPGVAEEMKEEKSKKDKK